MNPVLQQLTERKSVRVFTDQPITAQERETILLGAVNAPTAGNQQMYTVLDITDEEMKQKLAQSCDDQPFIAQGKLVLIFCADCQKWHDGFVSAGCQPRKPGVGDLMLAVTDAVIAAQNAVVAAHSMGIGSCYIGDVMENCEYHRKLLKLPEYVFPAAMLVFGYPTQQQLRREKPARVALGHVVHENGYRRMDDEELQKMWQPRCAPKSYADWMKAFCERKYNSDFSREMTRSVSCYLQPFLSENEE